MNNVCAVFGMLPKFSHSHNLAQNSSNFTKPTEPLEVHLLDLLENILMFHSNPRKPSPVHMGLTKKSF